MGGQKVLWPQAFRKDRYRFEFDMTSQPSSDVLSR